MILNLALDRFILQISLISEADMYLLFDEYKKLEVAND